MKLPHPFARTALLSTLLLLATASLALPAAPAAQGAMLVVGYAPGGAPPAALAAYGQLHATDAALGIATLWAADADAATRALARHPGVHFVEPDGAVAAAGAARVDGVALDSSRWDSSRWDSSRWDSSRWDSSRWDSSRWDSSRWDSSRWDALLLDSSRWDSSRWDSSRWDSSRWDSSRWDGAPLVPDPLLPYQWGLAEMNVPDAWATSTGANERVLCVVDTGVDATHPDLAPNMWRAADGSHGWSFLSGSSDVRDAAGHGTHVAGVAAAAIGNGIGTAGVANVQIMAVQVLNEHGIGGMGNVAQGVRWCSDHGADIISMSLSSSQDSNALRRAVAYAADRGALLVASAGNLDGCPGCPVYPAAYDRVVGVAAFGMDRAPAPFGDPAAHVDLAAPGELIAGPIPGDSYALGSGTSQATALVAGAAALAWDLRPDLTAAQIEALLYASARDMGEPGWDAASGWGMPQADALLALAAAS